MNWEEFEANAQKCRSCGLCNTRNNVVIGRGSRNTGRILFVGEGPGENEDRRGIPFVGQAAAAATGYMMIQKIGEKYVDDCHTIAQEILRGILKR